LLPTGAAWAASDAVAINRGMMAANGECFMVAQTV